MKEKIRIENPYEKPVYADLTPELRGKFEQEHELVEEAAELLRQLDWTRNEKNRQDILVQLDELTNKFALLLGGKFDVRLWGMIVMEERKLMERQEEAAIFAEEIKKDARLKERERNYLDGMLENLVQEQERNRLVRPLTPSEIAVFQAGEDIENIPSKEEMEEERIDTYIKYRTFYSDKGAMPPYK